MQHPALIELLQHASALRALARDLVGDGAADDVLQETAIQAMTAPPRRPGPAGGWLRSVVQHMAGRHRRAERLRRLHELRASRPEAQPADRSAESADTLRRLTEIVTALPEPYRGAVLARYLRELTPSEIAAETGTPVRTVKTRLQRGLALLRERFAEGDSDWRSMLVAAFGLDHAVTASVLTSTILFMNTTTKAVLAAGVLLLGGALAWQLATPAITPPAEPAITTAQAAPVAAAVPGPASTNQRIALEPPPSPAPKPDHAAPASAGDAAIVDPVVVRAVDANSGAPVETFALRAAVDPGRAIFGAAETPQLHGGSHARGRLVLPAIALADRTFHLEDGAHRYAPSRWFTLADALQREGERVIEVRLVVPVEVEVTILRSSGREPVAGSKVEVLRPWIGSPVATLLTNAQLAERFRAQPDETGLIMKMIGGRAMLLSSGTTDAKGRVQLQAPPGESLALRLFGPGHRPAVHSDWVVPATSPPVHTVELVDTGGTIRGRVFPSQALGRLRPEQPSKPEDMSILERQESISGLRLRNKKIDEVIPPQPVRRGVMPLADDGTFTIDGLAAGDWQVSFCYPLRVQTSDQDPFSGPYQMEIPLSGVDDLHDEEVRVVDLDLSALVPGQIEATLTPPDLERNHTLVVMPVPGPGVPLGSSPNLRSNRDGRFLATLPPARYLATLVLGPGQHVPLADFEIRPGATTHVDFVVETRSARFRVFEADGKTPASGLLSLGIDRRWSGMYQTDTNGLLEDKQLPRGELRGCFYPLLPAGSDPALVRYRSLGVHDGLFGEGIDLGAVLPAAWDDELRVLTLPAR